MALPLIGITAYAQPARFGAWDLPAALIPLMYVDALEAAGGRAMVVPPSETGVAETLDSLDGLVLSGGADLDPHVYGAEPHPETDSPQERRDRAELALLAAALERDMPVLGICRGSQLLNVIRGGDLDQHLPETVGHTNHRETPGVFSEHLVEIRDGTRLAAAVGGSTRVTSSHHQGLGRVGTGLVEAAWAEDGTLEAIEDPRQRFALGVLWHPEAMGDRRLFDAFVAEARRYAAEQRVSRAGDRE